MEIPPEMFHRPPLEYPLYDYEWAILYLPHAEKDPFVKMPLIYDTYLGAQGSIGIDTRTRLEIHNGDIAYNVYSTYRIFMLLHSSFQRSIDPIVEITNAFYEYCLQDIDCTMARETAYSLCTSVFPPVTIKDVGIHVLLTLFELHKITNVNSDIHYLKGLNFDPDAELDQHLTR